MNTIICNICGLEKELIDFHFRKDSNTYRKCCKKCYNSKTLEYKRNNKTLISENNKEYYREHQTERRIYRKQFYIENKEYELSRNKKYSEYNKDKLQIYYKQYARDHKQEISEYQKEYSKNNSDKIRIKNNLYSKRRKLIDPVFKLRSRLSTSIWISLAANNSSKSGKSILQYLPYKITELKEHLEKQFESWMSWENYGRYSANTWDDEDQSTWTWNIDHIIPQSCLPYLLMEDENFKKCWALENLRPYSSKQNILDGSTKCRHRK